MDGHNFHVLPTLGETVQVDHYPGFDYHIRLYRNPSGKILAYFLPAILWSIIIIGSFEITNEGERLAALSVCILTYINIMDQAKSDLPELTFLTFADVFYFIFIFISCFPCILWYYGDTEEVKVAFTRISWCIIILSAIVLVYKYLNSKMKFDQEMPP